MELIGRSAELYDIVKIDGVPFTPNRPIFVSGFHGAWLTLDVKKKAGRESEELLVEQEGAKEGGLWNSVSGLFKKPTATVAGNGTLHCTHL